MSEPPPSTSLLNYISGAWISQAIYIVAKLGVADHLIGGPKMAADLAQAVGVATDPLNRVLRLLASLGIFRQTEPGRYALTPMAQCLRSDLPDSLRAVAIMYGEPWHRAAWSAIQHSLQTGQPAFNQVHGQPFFDHVQQHPDAAGVFDQAMTSFSNMEIPAVLQGYDFSPIQKLVDVGGGHGSLLAAILKANPSLRGVLFDLPTVIEGARRKQHLHQAGVAERCELVEGDFFQAVPAGGDAYLMKHIIHDWSDAHCLRILRNCRQAIRPNGRVLLVEMVLPAGDEPHFGKLLDLEMLIMTQGGRERTEAEYRALCHQAGFQLTRIVPLQSPASVIEAVAV